MHLFTYEALDGSGQRKTGTIEAEDRVRALKKLGLLGLTPSKLGEASPIPRRESQSAPSSGEAGARSSRQPRAIVLVSSGTRFLNMIIDLVASVILSMVFGALLVTIALMLSDTHDSSSEEGGLVQALMSCVMLFVPPAYYVVFEGIWGQTLGKMSTGTIVVDESGNKAGIGQVIGRTLARLLPFEAFSCFGRKSRGWHDSIAGTYVVRKVKASS